MIYTESLKKNFWNFKAYEESVWFKKLVITLVGLGIIYVFLHLITDSFFTKYEYEYVKLDKDQMQQINRIYFDSSKRDTSLLKNTTVNLDSLKLGDTIINANNQVKKYHGIDTSNCNECTKEQKVICFLWNEFNHKLDSAQMNNISQYLNCSTGTEATNFLLNQRFQIKSYFWLTGPLVYWEIIFWSWFGVICSILFNLGVISKNSTTNPQDPTTYFDSSEIPSQVAKLLYAPACTLAIVLGYNFFNGDNLVDINSSKGVLVFAFIGGFYSSRLISFLDRLKEILLPISSTAGKGIDNPPLKNIVVQLQLDTTVVNLWDSLKGDLNSLKVTLQEEQSTQQAIALPIDTNQWPLFIFDFVKPGTYSVEASWTTKQNDQVINLKAQQKVEMRNTDQSVTLKLTTLGTVAAEGENEIKNDNVIKPLVAQPPADGETPADIDINKKSEDND